MRLKPKSRNSWLLPQGGKVVSVFDGRRPRFRPNRHRSKSTPSRRSSWFPRAAVGLAPRPVAGPLGLLASALCSEWTCSRSRREARFYTARRRSKWPGEAAVTVSAVHIAKGSLGPAPIASTGKRCRSLRRSCSTTEAMMILSNCVPTYDTAEDLLIGIDSTSASYSRARLAGRSLAPP